MWIDLIVVAVVACYAVVGYRWGLATAVLSLGGFALGIAVGWHVALVIAGAVRFGLVRMVLVLGIIIVIAGLGQAVGLWLGNNLRNQLAPFRPARVLDHVLGGLAAAVSVSMVAALIGQALVLVTNPTISRVASSSRLLGGLESVLPSEVSTVAGTLSRAISNGTFPQAFGLEPERIMSVSAPDSSAIPVVVKRAVQAATVKVTGDAPACRRGQEGSAAVVAHERVVTNAHVVAGITHPLVVASHGRTYPARVVRFDPELDVAVLAVPGLPSPALESGAALNSGADAMIAGYPEDGPYAAGAVRVRGRIMARGQDIYGRPGPVREVYSLRGTVRQGNSGGPMIDQRGRLVGLVFATSLDDGDTGYALTWNQISAQVRAGIEASDSVPTGGCTVV